MTNGEMEYGKERMTKALHSMPQTLMIYIALVTSAITFGKVIFFSGSSTGAMQAHVDYDDKRIDELYVRVDRDETLWQSEVPVFQEAVAESERTSQQEQQILSELQRRVNER